VAAFEKTLAALQSSGIDPGLRHLNASGGILDEANPAWDMARVGLAFYGHLPTDVSASAGRAAAAGRLRPVTTLKARAASVETIAPGTSVGYGGEWTAERESRIATIALGYADGWMRKYAGARASVRGLPVALAGRVGSDAVAVDVTDVPGFDAADEVVVLSPDGPTTIEDLARMRGSIAWEVMDNLGPRIARVYLEGGTPMAVRYLDGRLVLAAGAQLVTRPAAAR
jgi:alanine racemase